MKGYGRDVVLFAAVGVLTFAGRSLGDNRTERTKLIASDGQSADFFGWSVSIDADRIVVGAYQIFFERNGAAYVYRLDDNDTPFQPGDDFWMEEAKLTAPEPTKQDLFGARVSLSGDLALISSARDDECAGRRLPSLHRLDAGRTYPSKSAPWALVLQR